MSLEKDSNKDIKTPRNETEQPALDMRSQLLDEFMKSGPLKREMPEATTPGLMFVAFETSGQPETKTTDDRALELNRDNFKRLGPQMAEKLGSFNRVVLKDIEGGKLLELTRDNPLKLDAPANSGLKTLTIDKTLSAELKIDATKVEVGKIKGLSVQLETPGEGTGTKDAAITGFSYTKDAEKGSVCKITVAVDGKDKEIIIPLNGQTAPLFRAMDALQRVPGEYAAAAPTNGPKGIDGRPTGGSVGIEGDGETPIKNMQRKDELNSILNSLLLFGSATLAISGTYKIGRSLLARDGGPTVNLGERSTQLEKDAKDYLKKEPLMETRSVKQYLYEAGRYLPGKLEEINTNAELSGAARTEAIAKAFNEFNAKFFTVMNGKNSPNAQMLKNMELRPLGTGEQPGLSFESTEGQPLKLVDGKIVNQSGEPVAAANVKPVYRVPAGLFSNPQLLLRELYCDGLLGAKQTADAPDRATKAGKETSDVRNTDTVARDLARSTFETANKETAANEMKVAVERTRKAAGEGFQATEHAALTQLRRAELSMENGVAMFRGNSIDLVAAARERIKEIEGQLEAIRKHKEGKKDASLPQDGIELAKLERSLTDSLAEYKPALAAAEGKNFEALHTIAGREITEKLAESELGRGEGAKGSGRAKAYVFLFAGVLGIFLGTRKPSEPAPSTPVYAPVTPKK